MPPLGGASLGRTALPPGPASGGGGGVRYGGERCQVASERPVNSYREGTLNGLTDVPDGSYWACKSYHPSIPVAVARDQRRRISVAENHSPLSSQGAGPELWPARKNLPNLLIRFGSS